MRLYTRHNSNCTRQYPELQLPFSDDVILDGEVACVDQTTGVSDFESAMSRFQSRKTDKIQQLTATLPADRRRYRVCTSRALAASESTNEKLDLGRYAAYTRVLTFHFMIIIMTPYLEVDYMCGRYTITVTLEYLIDDSKIEHFAANYRLAPMQNIPTVIGTD
ncbi:hypothetical protein BSK59_28795 [Paenibacillus odorifer]|uniref:hypothetical protein n=1 Tax=Paenibacillus odorifer TaxID=189426 RepID=UPI00096D626F|nr:hypothetical protein [Paenibacillus odorifer]OME46845.1 hypothetical protein BSK59_28795 [Paenibacillus odorifer]